MSVTFDSSAAQYLAILVSNLEDFCGNLPSQHAVRLAQEVVKRMIIDDKL